MKDIFLPVMMLAWLSMFGTARAAMECPPMPAAVTQLGHDVNLQINASVAKLGPVNAGQIDSKLGVEARALFDKFPNVDKLVAMQTMSSSYCRMLLGASITDADRLDRWERFQDRVLGLGSSAGR